MATEAKYSEKDEEYMRKVYNPEADEQTREEMVQEIVNKLGKTPRSVIAKLAKMKLYVAKVNTSKITGEKPKTKEELVSDFEAQLGINPGQLMGLEKAPKRVIVLLQRICKEYNSEG